MNTDGIKGYFTWIHVILAIVYYAFAIYGYLKGIPSAQLGETLSVNEHHLSNITITPQSGFNIILVIVYVGMLLLLSIAVYTVFHGYKGKDRRMNHGKIKYILLIIGFASPGIFFAWQMWCAYNSTPVLEVVFPPSGDIVDAHIKVDIKRANLGAYTHIYVVTIQPDGQTCWIFPRDLGSSLDKRVSVEGVNIGEVGQSVSGKFTIMAIATVDVVPKDRMDAIPATELPAQRLESSPVYVIRR